MTDEYYWEKSEREQAEYQSYTDGFRQALESFLPKPIDGVSFFAKGWNDGCKAYRIRHQQTREALFGALKVGDYVEVHRLGYLGTGTISEVSDKLDRGLGTKTFKAFHVEFNDGGSGWFSASSLTKIKR